MADNASAEGGQVTEGGAPAESGAEGKAADTGKAPSGGEGKTFTQAEVDALLAPLQEAANELTKIKESQKTELQKALDRAAEAEKRAEQAEFERLRERVANRPGKVVPVASLTGKTEAELIASADALLAWRDENAPKPPEQKQQRRNPAGGGGLKSGASGADSGSADPKVRAAEALRRLRSGD
ncbi:scaffolding protein [Mycobacterium phage LilPharaoh]|uniref:Scaffolding protein n=1 Tax=Mycobacterium phage Amelie TaxID=1913035 RepID=A0A1J0GQ78_9CAUD|nr:head scaffolding protein [Mycobacterium phage Enkosi]YP_009952526.1 head scaffolding protein [Mycobacterium phage Amelie]ATN90461.1 scaffolding protein [Mycobacterium phage LilPharaoh]AVP42585.1 scaffolding protein [Mycobacterium phage SgtBeansprout]AXC37114.1 scaffolding protein [Mycobacterium phage Biglebops]QGJ93293.1 scaffolding protein [Mycobacterium phage Mdavu]UQS94409.1 scaffolding protein [Mycobacterium phage Nutello]UXE03170.1 scaffolding protein [Mycobacterium phage Nikao]